MISPPAVTDIRIRPMQMEDLSPVQAIDQISFSLPWPASAYRYELNENESSLLWVAEAETPEGERRVVGLVVLWLILDEAHIASIAVHPDFRGLAIGQRLMATALQGALAKGAVEATLEVRSGNLTAQSLYRRFRFEVVGCRPHYYRDNNEDALIMTLGNLGPAYQEWLESEAWRETV